MIVFSPSARLRKGLQLALSLFVLASLALPALAESVNELLDKGASAFDRGNYSEAIREYRKVLQQDSRNSVAMMGVAKSLLAGGKMTEAKVQLLQITQQHPDFGAPYYLLGTIYEQESDPVNARASYQKYVEHSKGSIPPDPAIRIKLRQFGVY